MKRLCAILLSFLVTSFSVQSVSAVNLDFSLSVNDKVQTGKSFSATINVSGGGDLSAVIFTVVFDPGVMEFSSAALKDGTDGKIESDCAGGALTIVFLYSNGTELSVNEKGIIDLKFKALSTPCTAYLTIYAQQAVSSDESYLSTASGIEYAVELQEKINGSVSQSSGTQVSEETSSTAENSRSATSAQSGNAKNGADPDNNTSVQVSNSSLGADTSNNDGLLFVFRFVAALCVVSAAVGIYAFGKRRGERVLAQKIETSQEIKEDKTE